MSSITRYELTLREAIQTTACTYTIELVRTYYIILIKFLNKPFFLLQDSSIEVSLPDKIMGTKGWIEVC
jgi:hypothetical protein